VAAGTAPPSCCHRKASPTPAPGYFAHIVLLPGADLGVVVLANAYSPARDAQLAAAAFDLARVIYGQPPQSASTDPLFTVAGAGLLATATLLLGILVWSFMRAVRHRGTPASARRVIAGTVGWLAGCAALIVGTAWALPASMGADLGQAMLWTPDLAHLIVAVVVLCAGIASVRVARTADALIRQRRGSAVVLVTGAGLPRPRRPIDLSVGRTVDPPGKFSSGTAQPDP
jgi:hypothetical protein